MPGGRDFFAGNPFRSVAPAPAFRLRPYVPVRRGPRGDTTATGQDVFWLFLAGSIAGFVLLVFQPNRERIREAKAECRLLRREIAALEGRTEHLRGWGKALGAGDRDAWSAVARERLGWLAPGERLLGSRPPPEPRRPLNVVYQTGPP